MRDFGYFRGFFDFLLGPSVSKRLRLDYSKDDEIRSFLGESYPMDEYYTKLAIMSLGGKNALASGEISFIVKEDSLLSHTPSGQKVTTIFDSNINVEVKNLVDDRQCNRILIIGAPGTGKTTLLRNICYKWSKKELWYDKFDCIFTVQLEYLAAWLEDEGDYGGKKAQRSGGDDRSYYARFIYFSNERSRPYRTDKFTDGSVTYAELLQCICLNKLLLLLDGYDEIMITDNRRSQAKSIDEDSYTTERLQSEAEKLIQAFNHVIITSRPNALESGRLMKIDTVFTKILENTGFDKGCRQLYIQRYFINKGNPHFHHELMEFIEQNPDVQTICRTPLNAELICYLWQDVEARIELKKRFNRTVLYKLIEGNLDKWYKERHGKQQVESVYKDFTAAAAYKALEGTEEPRVIRYATVLRPLLHANIQEKEAQNLFLQEVANLGFLLPVYRGHDRRQDHYFAHKTFLEYFAAKHLSKLLEDPKQKTQALSFIQKKKTSPRHLEVLKFLAGLLTESQAENFWRAILQQEDQVTIMNDYQQIIVLMRLLSQADHSVPSASCKMAKVYIGDVITDNPLHWLDTMQATQYPINDVVDVLLGKLGEYLHEPPKAVPIITVLTTIFTTGAESYKKIMQTLIGLLGSSSTVLVTEVIHGLKKLAYSQDDQLYQGLEEAFVSKMEGSDEAIAIVATEAIVSLKQLSEKVFTTLLTNLKHENPWIVITSIETIAARNNMSEEQVGRVKQAMLGVLGNQSWNATNVVKAAYQQLTKMKLSYQKVLAFGAELYEQGDKKAAMLYLGNLATVAKTAKEKSQVGGLLLDIHAKMSDWRGNLKVGKEAVGMIVALGQLGNDQAIKKLISATNHKEISIAEAAVVALLLHREHKIVGTDESLKVKIDARFARSNEIRFTEESNDDEVEEKEWSEVYVAKLTKRLMDSGWVVKQGAIKALGVIAEKRPDLTNQEVVLAIIESLQDSNCGVVEGAIKALGVIAKKRPQLMNQEVALAMTDHLKDRNYGVMEGAIKALGIIAEKRSDLISQGTILAMTECLRDSEWVVRYGAINALGIITKKRPEIMSQEVALAMTERLKDMNCGVVEGAIKALGAIAEKRPELINMRDLTKSLVDTDWIVMSRATKAVGAIAEQRPELIDMEDLAKNLRDIDWIVRSRAAEVLGAIAEKRPDLMDREVALSLIKLLGDIDWIVRSRATEALGAIAEKRSELINTEDLTKNLEDSDWRVRSGAAEALGTIAEKRPGLMSQEAALALTNTLKDSECLVRDGAAKALGAIAQKRPELMTQEAAFALTKCLGNSDLGVIERSIKTLEAIAEKRSELMSKKMALALVEFLGNSDWRVRSGATSALIAIAEKRPELMSQEVALTLIERLGNRECAAIEGATKALQTLVEKRPELMRHEMALVFTEHLDDVQSSVRNAATDSLVLLVKCRPFLAELLFAFLERYPMFKEIIFEVLERASFFEQETVSLLLLSTYRSPLMRSRALALMSQARVSPKSILSALKHLKTEGLLNVAWKKIVNDLQKVELLDTDALETLYGDEIVQEQPAFVELLTQQVFDQQTTARILQFLLKNRVMVKFDYRTGVLWIGGREYPMNRSYLGSVQEACENAGLLAWPTAAKPLEKDELDTPKTTSYKQDQALLSTTSCISDPSSERTNWALERLSSEMNDYRTKMSDLTSLHDNPYTDAYQKALYDTLVSQLCSLYNAVSAVQHDIVKNQRTGVVGFMGEFLKRISPYMPMFGAVAELLAAFISAVDAEIQEKMLARFFKLATTQGAMEKLAYATSRVLVEAELDQEALDTPECFREALYRLLSDLADPTEFLASRVMGMFCQQTRTEEAKAKGERHGNKLSALIIVRVYNGEMEGITVNADTLSQLALRTFAVTARNLMAKEKAKEVIDAIRKNLEADNCEHPDRENVLKCALSEVFSEPPYCWQRAANYLARNLVDWQIVKVYKPKLPTLWPRKKISYKVKREYCNNDKLSLWIRAELERLAVNQSIHLKQIDNKEDTNYRYPFSLESK